MKNTFPKNRPVWLRELFDNFATKKELLENFITKKELYKNFYTKEEIFEIYATKEDMKKFRDDILTAIDEVLGEIQDSREEQTLIAHRLSEYADTLENHETRISKLETTPLQ